MFAGKELFPNVFIFYANNQHHIASAFIRLQEYYESPFDDIRGHYFGLDQYMDIYADTRGGVFSYLTDWNGFNVPGDTVREFFQKFLIQPLTQKEQYIYETVKHVLYTDEPFYIIGVHANRMDCLNHEIGHALYTTNPEYKQAVTEKIDELFEPEFIDLFKEGLVDMGYCDHVLDDEVQAYFTTTWQEYFQDKFPKSDFGDDTMKLIDQVEEVYKQFVTDEMLEDFTKIVLDLGK